jgi:hypothetical protein
MRARHAFSLAQTTRQAAVQSPCTWRLHLHTCVVQPRGVAPEDGNHVRTRDRLLTTPAFTRRKKTKKSALRSSVSLDKKRPHKGQGRGAPVKSFSVTTPVFNSQLLDPSEMPLVVCDNDQVIGHRYACYKDVDVVDRLSLLPQISIDVG